MTASDAFSEYYAELLQGTYDCVDRIVLNAFFPVGQTAGGLRTWWRFLRGDDLSLASLFPILRTRCKDSRWL
jgi:hypothetical protein